MDIAAFSNALANGRTFRAAVVDEDLNFLSQQVFALDFDGVPYSSMLEITEETGIYPAIVYPTFSQPVSEPLSHYRMIFVSDHPITDKNSRDAIMQRLMHMYDGYCDPKCKDTTRMFFGGRTSTYHDNYIYNFEQLWMLDHNTLEISETKK